MTLIKRPQKRKTPYAEDDRAVKKQRTNETVLGDHTSEGKRLVANEPSRARKKSNSPDDYHPPPAFWDGLSKVWLELGALI